MLVIHLIQVFLWDNRRGSAPERAQLAPIETYEP
jgi:hypothetical protein